MHLLNTTTKQLESFYSENAPSYAILSHMWGKDEDEVTFGHMMGSDDARHEGEKRKGFAKIVGACKQAIEDGWKYIWIDTCCINKESSAELSEAINSMYKWYERAEVCYVYLEDVQSGYQNNLSKDIRMDSRVKIVPFEHSRWFSRGWTLQELIAPRYMVFYSRDWIDIGTKASLQDIISSTTRIRVEMLMAYDPKKASVAEKMSWAAFRKTTREEDTAYCLMGLFGVNMPLLYGEGDKAFRRLQEEIMKVSDDHSLFAWKAAFGKIDDNNGRDRINEKTRGMLAYCPWNFRNGMDIAPSSDGAYSPYSMTNQGLQIQLPLEPIDPKHDKINIDSDSSKNIFKITLKCTIRNKQPIRWVVIYLKMIRRGCYQRIFPHWLDETETKPNEDELTSLLIPQVGTPVNPDWRSPDHGIKILPTKCGFTVDGHSLVKGYEGPIVEYYGPQITFFRSLDGRHFAVVVGVYGGLPWLDVRVIDVNEEWSHPQKYRERKNEINKDYKEGGRRRNVVSQNLDRLFMNILSNWLMVVSVKKIMEHKCFPSRVYLCTTVDIQPWWYTPPAPLTSTGANSFGDSSHWGYFDSYLHPNFKKEYSDSIVVFNPKAKVNVNLIHNITSRLPTDPSEHYFAHSVRFSPDGKYLAFVYKKTLRVYDTNTGAETCLLFDETHSDSGIGCICFSPDSKLLAASTLPRPSHNREIKLWDIEKRDICKVFGGHLDDFHSLYFSPDGRLIISGSSNGIIRTWDIITDEASEILTVDTDPRYIGFLHDGRLVAVLSENYGVVRIWDIATTQLVKKFELEKVELYLLFTPNEKGLLIGGRGSGLGYWDVGELVSAQAEGIEDSSGTESANGPRVLSVLDQGERSPRIISKDGVRSMMAISHDAHWVVFGSYDGSVLFCDLKDATTQFVLHWGDQDIFSCTSVDMSPVGNIFATGSKDGTVRIWSYDTASDE